MNTSTACELAGKIAEMIAYASTFQCQYGKDYRMKPGSPDEAWELYQAIFNQQVAIASLLDIYALENPARILPMWWKIRETLDTSSATQISQEACHLIACCACYEADPGSGPSPAIRSSQCVIAGMLHPSAVLVALDELGQAQKAS
jgi:hypothetical protein